MKGLKGLKVQGHMTQYTLKNPIGQGGFATIYSTQNDDIICKVQNLSSTPSTAYRKQKTILMAVKHPSLVRLLDWAEVDYGESRLGLLFMENCSRGNMFRMVESAKGDLQEQVVVNVFHSVASGLEAMHKFGWTHRDVKLENVLVNKSGQYKLIDFGSATDKIVTEVNRGNRSAIEEEIEKNTTPIYRAPEQLDLYSGFEIGPKVDVFALGCMIFMMCFKKQPFQMRLSAINNQYFMPQQSIYSEQLKDLIRKCFTPNPCQRPTSSTLVKLLKPLVSVSSTSKLRRSDTFKFNINIDVEFEKVSSEFQNARSTIRSQTEVVKPSMFGKFKRMISQMTTETESWITGFIEESQESPPVKYNRNLIAKCWDKRYKVEKVYSIVLIEAGLSINKSLVVIKILILLHNFLKKGPREAILGCASQGAESENMAVKILVGIYKGWRKMNPNDRSEDPRRDLAICLIIQLYSLVLIEKVKLCETYSCFIEGNYCPLPYLMAATDQKILSVRFIQDIIGYFNKLLSFHEKVDYFTTLPAIQRSIILSLIDQQYCLICFLIHLYCTFKQSTNFLPKNPQIDQDLIRKKLSELDSKILSIYSKLLKLFEIESKKYTEELGGKFFKLSYEVIGYVKGIQILSAQRKQVSFDVNRYISFERNIYGLTMPDTYEGVVNRIGGNVKSVQPGSSENVMELGMFRKKNLRTEVDEQQRDYQYAQQRTERAHATTQGKSQKPQVPQTKQQYPSKQSKPTKPTATIPNFTSTNPTCTSTNPSLRNNPTPSTNPSSLTPQPPKIPAPCRLTSSASQPTFVLYQNTPTPVSPISSIFPTEPPKQPAQPGLFDNFLRDADIMEFSHQSMNMDFTKSIVEENIVSRTTIMEYFEDTPVLDSPAGGRDLICFEESQEGVGMEQRENRNANLLSIDLIRFDEDQDQTPTPRELLNFNQNTNSQYLSQNSTQFQQFQSKQHPLIPQLDLLSFTPDPQPLNFPQSPPQSPQPLPNKPRKQLQINRLSSVRITPNPPPTIPQSFSPRNDIRQFITAEVSKSANQFIIDLGELEFGNPVGSGTSSEVFFGSWRGQEVAIKKIKLANPTLVKEFQREIMTCVKIRPHPHLASMVGVAERPGSQEMFIISEFCHGGTLFQLLHQTKIPINWSNKVYIAKQIAKGMLFLHMNNPPTLHRDLKSLNILLTDPYQCQTDKIRIKIADFGLSRQMTQQYMTGSLGTYHWMAPQIFNNKPYSTKADVYSFAIVLWQIITRRLPYKQIQNPHAIMNFVANQGGRPETLFISSRCPPVLKELMIRCWDAEPAKRPDFREVLAVLGGVTFG